MTRTEDDLRTLLHAPLDADAPARVLARVTHTEPTVTSTRTDTPRRTWRVGLATGLALVVVGGTVTAVLVTRPDDRAAPTPAGTAAVSGAPVNSSSPTPAASNPGPGPLPPHGTVVSFLAGSGYELGATMLFPGEETADAVPDGATTAVATVHAGPTDLTPSTSKPAVTLAPGVTASWASGPASAANPSASGADTLLWTVDGLTITVQPRPGTSDAVTTAVARAVLIGAPEPLPVPVSVSAWPAAGWTVTGLVSTYVHRDGATGTPGRDLLIDISLPGQDGTAVTIDSAGLAFGGGTDGGTPVVVDGRTWLWDATSSTFTWQGPDRFVRVTSSNAGVGRDTLQTLVAAITPATAFGDESTWFQPSDAFPPA